MTYQPNRLTILVIEDNPGDYLLIEDYLLEMIPLAEIVHARNFKEAVSCYKERSNDIEIVLLDVTLPDNQGLKLVNDILFAVGHLPVIVLTGYENLSFSVNSLSLGVSDYLLKDEINAYILYKSIIFSIERMRYTKKLEISQKRYENLFQLSPIPVWLYDLVTLKFIDVNIASIKHYGYSKDEFLELTMLDILADFSANSIEQIKKNHLDFFNGIVMKQKKKSGEIIEAQIEVNYIEFDNRTCCIMLSNDITELISTQKSLNEAFQNLIDIEESEKEKFASELHDGLAQKLVAANLMINLLNEQFPQIDESKYSKMLKDTLQDSLNECSTLVKGVRPKTLMNLGFQKAIEEMIEDIEMLGFLKITYHHNIKLEEFFNSSELMHLMRIIQELFNNAIKHSKAKVVNLSLDHNSNFMIISYSDNGVGIPNKIILSPGNFLSLKRRTQILNGDYVIKNSDKGGVEFIFNIPIGS